MKNNGENTICVRSAAGLPVAVGKNRQPLRIQDTLKSELSEMIKQPKREVLMCFLSKNGTECPPHDFSITIINQLSEKQRLYCLSSQL